MTHDPITALANAIMTAVAKSGAIRSADLDGDLAVKIMREELKAFLTDDKYRDERELAKTGGKQHLVIASLIAECISRILKERT